MIALFEPQLPEHGGAAIGAVEQLPVGPVDLFAVFKEGDCGSQSIVFRGFFEGFENSGHDSPLLHHRTEKHCTTEVSPGASEKRRNAAKGESSCLD